MSKECYSSHAEVPLVNALDECRAELEKLKAGAKVIAEAVVANHKWHVDYDDEGYPGSDLANQNIEAIAASHELGLLEDK